MDAEKFVDKDGVKEIMTPPELAYIAGFFDGEGYIGITFRQGKGYRWRTLQAKVGNTNEWVINYLKFSFGGSIYKRKVYGNQRQSFDWTLVGNQAASFLKLILPFLKLKRPQAEIAIRFQERKSKRNWRKMPPEIDALEEAENLLLREYKHANG